MKKKGLIISTVAMVVVLIAALTTSTYAWFTVSNKTTIDGFDVSVVAGNAVNIGVKTDNTHKLNAVNEDFLSGSVTYSGTAGMLGGGTWSGGSDGLSATLNHGIKWGEQSKAVGAINATSNTKSTTASEYGFIGTGSFNSTSATGKANSTSAGQKTFLNAANASQSSTATLTGVEAAVANLRTAESGGEATSGDYAYLFLGASPATDLVQNKLVILLDGSGSKGNKVGLLGAVHVAYRVTKANASSVTTEWTEKEFFEGVDYNTNLSEVSLSLSDTAKNAYKVAHNNAAAPTSRASAIVIDDLSENQGDIDQIELIIYLAGSDVDCNDNAKNTSGSIEIFFDTVSAEKTETPTGATVASDGKLTLNGVDGAKVEFTTDGGSTWTAVEGSWSTSGKVSTFTSTDALADVTSSSTIIVRVTETGKSASETAQVTNNKSST